MSASTNGQDHDVENLLTYCEADHIYFSFDNLPSPPSVVGETIAARRAPELAAPPSEWEGRHDAARIAPTGDALREAPPASIHDLSTAISMDDMFRMLSDVG